MENATGHRDAVPVPQMLRDVANAAGALIEEHGHLASVEIDKDAEGIVRELGVLVLASAMLVVGWLALVGALVVVLIPLLGLAGAAAVVGAVNLVAAALLGRAVMARLRARTWLRATRAQLRRSLAALGDALHEPLDLPESG